MRTHALSSRSINTAAMPAMMRPAFDSAWGRVMPSTAVGPRANRATTRSMKNPVSLGGTRLMSVMTLAMMNPSATWRLYGLR